MRTFLLTVFWITNLGSVLHLLIIAAAGWIILDRAYSYADLSVGVFITQYVPMLAWVKTFMVWLLADLGRWILALPVLIVSPLKIVMGTMIGYWAYNRARTLAPAITKP